MKWFVMLLILLVGTFLVVEMIAQAIAVWSILFFVWLFREAGRLV